MKSAKRRSILYRKAVGKARDSTYYIKYVTYRNLFNTIKRRARDSYYGDLLAKYQNDIRKTWKVLNNITGVARKRKKLSDTFLVNGEKCTDKVKIANEFC